MATRQLQAKRAGDLLTKLAAYATDRLYGGLAAGEITFDPSAPESNPVLAGYTRSTPGRHPLELGTQQGWREARAA